jgi:hypothetical protein
MTLLESRGPFGRAAGVAWGLMRSYGAVSLIGLIFIAASLLKLVGAEFSAGFTGWELAPAFAFEGKIYTGILVLVVIDVIGLLRKQRWARYTGIVLGPVLLLPDFLDFYAENDLGWRLEIGRILTDPIYLAYVASILCCSAYLVFFRSAADRSRSGFVTMALFAVLSFGAAALAVTSIAKLHGVVYVYWHNVRLAKQMIERHSLVGALKPGVPYRNSEYGFEMTFSDDRKVYSQDNGNSLQFSSTGLDGRDSFRILIEKSVKYRDSVEEIVRNDSESDSRNRDSVEVINGIACARLNFWGIGPLSYVFVRDGKLIHLQQPGGMDAASFEQVAHTFRFL